MRMRGGKAALFVVQRPWGARSLHDGLFCVVVSLTLRSFRSSESFVAILRTLLKALERGRERGKREALEMREGMNLRERFADNITIKAHNLAFPSEKHSLLISKT